MNNVIEKLKKLLALAQSPNENEAAVAMAQAIKIAQRENVNLDSIKGIEFDEPVQQNDGWAKGRFDQWEKSLLMAVAEIFGCRIIQGWKDNETRWRNNTHLIVIGRPSDAEVVIYLANYLNRQLINLWNTRKYSILARSRYSEQKTRLDYLLGATERIKEKITELYKADTPEQEYQQQQGLVLKRNAMVERFMDNMKLTKGRSSTAQIGNSARFGYSDAGNITIHRGVESSGKQTAMID